MARYSVLQSFTFLLLLGASGFVAHRLVQYVLKADGGYSKWSGFTACSVTCAGGVRKRMRTCTNPLPRFGGRECSRLGPAYQMFKCNLLPCPIHGGYGEWQDYGKCSKYCGGGEQESMRECNKPAPQFGGKNCREMELGPGTRTRTCNQQPCPIDGGYSEWGPYTECSASCGGGKKSRTRTCTNPEPKNDGKTCEKLGAAQQTETCNTDPCPTTPPPTTTPMPTTNPTTLPTTQPTTQQATEPTSQATGPSTQQATEPTTQQATEPNTQPATGTTIKATTELATEPTTQLTNQSTKETTTNTTSEAETI